MLRKARFKEHETSRRKYISKREVLKMTKEQSDAILGYVAQNIISPLAFDERPASKVWEELTGEPFNKLVKLVKSFEKPIDKSK